MLQWRQIVFWIKYYELEECSCPTTGLGHFQNQTSGKSPISVRGPLTQQGARNSLSNRNFGTLIFGNSGLLIWPVARANFFI